MGPGRAPRQEVGEIEEMRRRLVGLRLVLLEPEDLRRFHFGRHDAAHIAQHRMAGPVDAAGLFERAVIHPHDDVAIGIA